MYRVGVIGCRGIGIRHGNGVMGIENAEIVGGCDIVDEQLRDFDERYGATNTNLVLYKDFQEMLEKAELDIGPLERILDKLFVRYKRPQVLCVLRTVEVNEALLLLRFL